MSYEYQTEKPKLFTESGQVQFLRIRDTARDLITKAGAVQMGKLLCGDSWQAMACVDRLVELNELREVTQQGSVAGQDRVFVSNR